MCVCVYHWCVCDKHTHQWYTHTHKHTHTHTHTHPYDEFMQCQAHLFHLLLVCWSHACVQLSNANESFIGCTKHKLQQFEWLHKSCCTPHCIISISQRIFNILAVLKYASKNPTSISFHYLPICVLIHNSTSVQVH